MTSRTDKIMGRTTLMTAPLAAPPAVASSAAASSICSLKCAPIAARMTLGLHGNAVPAPAMTRPTPAAAAVRNKLSRGELNFVYKDGGTLFATRRAAQAWCRAKRDSYRTRYPKGHVCHSWRWRPVRVIESIKVAP